jgi:hypothetical protein
MPTSTTFLAALTAASENVIRLAGGAGKLNGVI